MSHHALRISHTDASTGPRRRTKLRQSSRLSLSATLLFLVAGCAHAPLNRPISQDTAPLDYRFPTRHPPKDRDDLVLTVYFSGGGTRAAAFSYGVLQALQDTTVRAAGGAAPLLKQVDVISAVSGGSFTAAYYCIHGDRTFSDFESAVLKHNIQGALLARCLRPDYLTRMSSPFFGRSDLAAEYYDRTLFGGATFQSLTRQAGRPFLIINATDLSTGARFGFTQTSFDLLGSDLATFPVARAVAASTAAPLLLTPVTLRNYATGNAREDLTRAELDDLLTDRFKRLIADLNSYADPNGRRFIHLIDGGVADNLGLRAVQEFTMLNGGLAGVLERSRLAKVNKFAVIVVDAAVRLDRRWNQRESPPGTLEVLSAIGSNLLSRGNFETTELFKQSMRLWQLDLHQKQAGRAGGFEFYLINVSFAAIADEQEREFFYNIPTGFTLPDATVDKLTGTAKSLLLSHPEFQRLLRDLQ